MDELRAEVVWRVERVRGGWCTVAKRAGVERASLYRAFKMKGRQPTLTTLLKVTEALGMKVKLTPM